MPQYIPSHPIKQWKVQYNFEAAGEQPTCTPLISEEESGEIQKKNQVKSGGIQKKNEVKSGGIQKKNQVKSGEIQKKN